MPFWLQSLAGLSFASCSHILITALVPKRPEIGVPNTNTADNQRIARANYSLDLECPRDGLGLLFVVKQISMFEGLRHYISLEQRALHLMACGGRFGHSRILLGCSAALRQCCWYDFSRGCGGGDVKPCLRRGAFEPTSGLRVSLLDCGEALLETGRGQRGCEKLQVNSQ